MLTPEYLNSCTDYLLGMYDALNQSIAEDIARRIVKTGQMTDSAKWQVKQLRENGELMQDIVKDVARISGKSQNEVKRLFQDSARTGVRYDAQPLLKAGYDIDLKLSPAMNQVLEAAIAKTNGNIRNLTMTTGSTTGGLYLEATNLAYMKVTSGGFSYYEAIREAIKQAAREIMVDRSNQRLNEAIENMIRMWDGTIHGQTIRNMYENGSDYESICEIAGIEYEDYEEE